MTTISTISKSDLALWQRTFKRDRSHRCYSFFFGDLRQANGSVRYAAMMLVEKLAAVTGGDAEAVERLTRQTRLDPKEFDSPWGKTVWLKWVVRNACRRLEAGNVQGANGELRRRPVFGTTGRCAEAGRE